MTNIEIAKVEGWMTRLCESLDALLDGVLETRDALRLLEHHVHRLTEGLSALAASGTTTDAPGEERDGWGPMRNS